jgi:hypothetical protein
MYVSQFPRRFPFVLIFILSLSTLLIAQTENKVQSPQQNKEISANYAPISAKTDADAPTIAKNATEQDSVPRIGGTEFLSKVPEAERRELERRLGLYIKYQKLRDWENLYNLLYEQREESAFILDQKQSPNDGIGSLNDFSSLIANFDLSLPDWISISGCADLGHTNQKNKKLKAFIFAYKVNNAWIFSTIEVSHRGIGTDPQPCQN